MTDQQYEQAKALNAKADCLVEQMRLLEPWQFTERLAVLDEFEKCMHQIHDILNDI